MSGIAYSPLQAIAGALPSVPQGKLFLNPPKEIIMPVKITAKQSVHLTASPKITLEQINKAVATAVGLAGCTGCGLLGIDLHFYGGDPVFEKFRTEGIAGAVLRNGPQVM